MHFSGFSLSLVAPRTLPGPSSCLGCCKRPGQLEDWEELFYAVIRHPDEGERYTDPAAFGDQGAGRGREGAFMTNCSGTLILSN